MLARTGSSPDNDGTSWNYQTTRARQTRQRGVTKVNQWLNLLKYGTNSNLVDMGWAAVRIVPGKPADITRTLVLDADYEATTKCLRRSRGETAAAKLDTNPVNRNTVNVGTVSMSPLPSCFPHEDGQVHRRLMAPRRGGGSVVVRGRESRLHGEGIQRDRSRGIDTPGGRR